MTEPLKRPFEILESKTDPSDTGQSDGTPEKVPAPTDNFDPLDLANLKISQDQLAASGVKKLLLTVPVRKPKKKEFIRVHPDESFQSLFAAIDMREVGGEIYLLTSRTAPLVPNESINLNLFTAITREGEVFLWPCRLPGLDGRDNEWWKTAIEGAVKAMDQWVRIVPGTESYKGDAAKGNLPPPDWPAGLNFGDLVRIAFKDRVIDDPNHLVLKRLRGEC